MSDNSHRNLKGSMTVEGKFTITVSFDTPSTLDDHDKAIVRLKRSVRKQIECTSFNKTEQPLSYSGMKVSDMEVTKSEISLSKGVEGEWINLKCLILSVQEDPHLDYDLNYLEDLLVLLEEKEYLKARKHCQQGDTAARELVPLEIRQFLNLYWQNFA